MNGKALSSNITLSASELGSIGTSAYAGTTQAYSGFKGLVESTGTQITDEEIYSYETYGTGCRVTYGDNIIGCENNRWVFSNSQSVVISGSSQDVSFLKGKCFSFFNGDVNKPIYKATNIYINSSGSYERFMLTGYSWDQFSAIVKEPTLNEGSRALSSGIELGKIYESAYIIRGSSVLTSGNSGQVLQLPLNVIPWCVMVYIHDPQDISSRQTLDYAKSMLYFRIFFRGLDSNLISDVITYNRSNNGSTNFSASATRDYFFKIGSSVYVPLLNEVIAQTVTNVRLDWVAIL